MCDVLHRYMIYILIDDDEIKTLERARLYYKSLLKEGDCIV